MEEDYNECFATPAETATEMAKYDVEIRYIQGKTNVIADAHAGKQSAIA